MHVFQDTESLIANWLSRQEKASLRIGDILVAQGLLTNVQVLEALELQKKFLPRNVQLGQILVSMGVVTAEQIQGALLEKFGVPKVRLSGFKIEPDVVKMFPAAAASKYRVIPVACINNVLLLASAKPLDVAEQADLRFAAGRSIDMVLAEPEEITRALTQYYVSDDTAFSPSSVWLPAYNAFDSGNSGSEAQITFKNILAEALRRKASDVNFVPEPHGLSVWYRLSGAMVDIAKVDKSLLAPISRYIKLLANMNLVESRLPQDGGIHLENSVGEGIDLRVSVLPSIYGESINIRVLNKELGPGGNLGSLGFSTEKMNVLERTLQQHSGLVLVTGPTGSGKTTTLYTILQELRKRNARIVTAEEPVEYSLPGLVQIPVGAGTKNLEFNTILRHILRHDPDVILIGEIRDEETARVAINAAMTGHLVFSTLHSMDAVSTIERLVDLKVPPYLVASTLSTVIAQRLVKLNCPHCLEADHTDGLELYGLTSSLVLKKGVGCSHCGNTGLVGRSLISEVMQVTPGMREFIRAGILGEPLRKAAREGGMQSLWSNALELAAAGKICADELMAYQLSAYV